MVLQLPSFHNSLLRTSQASNYLCSKISQKNIQALKSPYACSMHHHFRILCCILHKKIDYLCSQRFPKDYSSFEKSICFLNASSFPNSLLKNSQESRLPLFTKILKRLFKLSFEKSICFSNAPSFPKSLPQYIIISNSLLQTSQERRLPLFTKIFEDYSSLALKSHMLPQCIIISEFFVADFTRK